ncbi:MAG: alanyl-tRNA synthetase [Patescibacteria group bacterium]|nr:alanyl-tRNA synthetase [Patescibacteria group bacterium]
MNPQMTSSEIRSKFLAFFEKRGHVILPSASLVTPDEKGVTNATLFNTAGMQPLVPYLLGKPHPQGTRLVDSQKCLRTVDIDDIGDKTHATFFEMLGNWSLGDYFKKEAIAWSFEFLTDKKEGLGLNPSQLYITVFEGDANAPKDDEAADIWREIFKKNSIDGNRIFYMPASMNWWEAGENGPCGPDTEMYYDISNKFGGKGLTHDEFVQADSVRDVVEVWNDVFMQYEKKDGKIIGTLPKPSVDTGAGLERLTMTLQGVDNIYDTDLFKPVMSLMKNPDQTIRNKRIIADHLRASTFLISDGVVPSNTDRGYILRRLIRRAIISTTDKLLDEKRISIFVDTITGVYAEAYPELTTKKDHIKKVFVDEASKFATALAHGIKEFERLAKAGSISGADAFMLFSSFGLPIDVTKELAQEKNLTIDIAGYEAEFKKHQDLSRSGAEQKFKGGLADANDPQVIKYHTATHLLHQALHDVLGESEGGQKGSNITPERLRFDFSYGQKMTDEQKKRVEDIINEKIKAALPVQNVVMPKAEAEKTGARHFFGEKYGEDISIYFIGDSLESAYSKEFCGGPHVKNTSELGTFKIQKEEASSQGVRRIKAVLV